MPTPTEPGNYWWTPPPDWNMDTQIVHVARPDDGILCGQSLEQPCMPIRGWERGTWGERIPDSRTLKAMKAVCVAAEELRWQRLIAALADCPWPRAQDPCAVCGSTGYVLHASVSHATSRPTAAIEKRLCPDCTPQEGPHRNSP